MPLGLALIVIFILYIIDKHNRWRTAAKLTAALVVLGLVGFGGLYGWRKYSDYREENKEAAEARIRLDKEDGCMARMKSASKDWSDATQANARAACMRNLDAVGFDQTYLDAQGNPIPGFIPDSSSDWFARNAPKKRTSKPVAETKLKALHDTELTTQEFNDLVAGHVSEGDIVTLLSDGSTGVRIKTSDGTTGWATSGAFEVVKWIADVPGAKTIPAVDCYDAKGILVPDSFAKFGGVQSACAPGQTSKPRHN
jgi:hypothetical protein